VTVTGIIATVKEAARTQTMMLPVSPVLGALFLEGMRPENAGASTL